MTKKDESMQVSRLDHFLGGLAARHPSFFIRLGRLETRRVRHSIRRIGIDRPIYVTGLARSGTTIILELLASHPDAASHRYRDFPLVHLPVAWNWFVDRAGAGPREPAERAHKDRILVSQESPEAMEEVIWMAFFARSHDPSVSQVLDAGHSHPDFEAFYRDHIRKVLLVRGAKRYLAKGNYNVSRLGYLGRLFPDARFVIPVRDPVGHIASLMKQHRLFCGEEARDPKVLAHMRQVGHFEFGLDLRPINFGRREETERVERLWSGGDEVRGWAAYWSSVYSFLAGLYEGDEGLSKRMLFVDYGDFCSGPARVLKRLYSHCGLEVADGLVREQASRISAPGYYKPGLSAADISVIREETGRTAERIKKLPHA